MRCGAIIAASLCMFSSCFALCSGMDETEDFQDNLEGSLTSESRFWNETITNQPVTEEERAAEKAARQAAIAKDIERLKARLQTAPSPELTAKLHSKLEEVVANKGLVPEQLMVYGIRDIEPILKGQDALLGTMLDCLVQFKNDLAERDIDLIFLPLPPTPHVYAHDLVDGLEANQDYTPGWTKMLISMLENDIEVIDPIEEFRAHSKDKLLVKWANDFHTGDGGRMIAAKLLAERMQRYGFAKDLNQFTDSYEFTEVESGVTKTRIAGVNGHKSKEDKGFKNTLKDKRFTYLNVKRKKGSADNRRSDVVLIGDSQNHSSVYGSGWPTIAMSQVGGSFRWGSRSGGINDSLPSIYLTVVPDWAVQPRVVVVTSLTKYFWKETTNAPRKLPAQGATNADGVPFQPFDATVEFVKISKTPVEDSSKLDYVQALFHAAVKVVDGPMAGKEIGIRYPALGKRAWQEGKWLASRDLHEVGKQMKLRMHYLPSYLAQSGSNRGKSTWEVFDDTEQDLMIPIFYVIAGELVGKSIPK